MTCTDDAIRTTTRGPIGATMDGVTDRDRHELDATGELLAEACRLFDDPDRAPTVDEVAAEVGWSVRHLQRVMRDRLGVTASAYIRAGRAERVRQALRDGGAVSDVAYEAGYGSSRGFYEHGARQLGMKPADYRNGARGQSIDFLVVETTLGLVIAATTERGLCAVRIGEDRDALVDEVRAEFPLADLNEASDRHDGLAHVLSELAEGRAATTDVPLDLNGTAFQLQVWEALRGIEVGTVRTYGQVAELIGRATSHRAVANACGANPIALVVPCHRVVRADGALGGYRWGTDVKERLLGLEGAAAG